MALSADAGVATQVSAPGMPIGSGTAASTAAPGATAPGGQMAVSHAVLVLIGGAAVVLVAIGIVFRRPIGEA
jgi:hypothetical protein